ncbi:MAG: hypothetical protein KC519_08560 [Anaerolineae bacterium]|nr:hypothetical protein [Anaerolineae bacterium]
MTQVLQRREIVQDMQAPGGHGSSLAGVAAVLIGLLNISLMIYVVVTPSEQRYDVGEGLRYFAENPLPLTITWLVFITMTFLQYAVIPVVADWVQDVDRDWTRFASVLGIVGYTIMGASFLTLLGRVPEMAQSYVTGDAMTRAALVATGLPEIDPHGFLMFGGPALWLIIVNTLALRGKRLHPLHAYAGIALGLGHIGTVVADVLAFEPLNLVAAGAGALFYPIYFIWFGYRLLRTPRREVSAR